MLSKTSKYCTMFLLLGLSVTALADDWSAWQLAPEDNAISFRVRRGDRNPYSGLCNWGVEIRNDHNYTADVFYLVSDTAVPEGTKLDHVNRSQPSGAVNEIGFNLSCSGLYVHASGMPSSN